MTDREFVLDAMRKSGKAVAESLQTDAENMTGTELYAEEDYIPDFAAAVAKRTCWSGRPE